MEQTCLREEIIQQSDVGTIFAFIDEYGKARTAKIVKKDETKRIIFAVTEFDKNFIVPYKAVLWLQKEGNTRWPKGVYKLLKGQE